MKKKPTALFAVMKAYPFSSIQVFNSIPLNPVKGEPQRFIPVFESRKEAIAWGGTDENIVELTVDKSKLSS